MKFTELQTKILRGDYWPDIGFLPRVTLTVYHACAIVIGVALTVKFVGWLYG